MIRCLLLLVEFSLIGLGLGDSRLVILSLLFLALFLFVINLCLVFYYVFSLFSFFSSCNFLVCFVLFLHRVAFRICIILIKKKKTVEVINRSVSFKNMSSEGVYIIEYII